jgi:hypothetical protein
VRVVKVIKVFDEKFFFCQEVTKRLKKADKSATKLLLLGKKRLLIVLVLFLTPFFFSFRPGENSMTYLPKDVPLFVNVTVLHLNKVREERKKKDLFSFLFFVSFL